MVRRRWESIFSEIRDKGFFKLNYRLILQGKPRYVGLKIASFHEGGSEHLLVGLRAWQTRK